jgi:hypothetical protein
MLYGSKYWAVNRIIEQSMIVTEIVMLRWTSGVTREDKIMNEYVRGRIYVGSIMNMMRENRDGLCL